jgi:hypothetical protein
MRTEKIEGTPTAKRLSIGKLRHDLIREDFERFHVVLVIAEDE